jgi:cephalosporin hydroxylase
VISIDLENGTLTVEDGGNSKLLKLGTPEAFSLISKVWLRAGWDNKYVYSFTWLGRPIIQLPDDMIRLQELIYAVKPDLIIETGVAHGGSLIFYASLCKAMNRGRVIGVDIEIRSHNRSAIEQHDLFPFITLIEGDSTGQQTIAKVQAEIGPTDSVMIFLDSNHTKAHVIAELNAYAPLVTKGSYIVAMDGIMEQMVGAPRSHPDWSWNNPKSAALDFVKSNPEFVLEEPQFLFNEGNITDPVTYWPGGFIRRV